MARPIVLIPYLFRLADAISFRKDYSPPSSPPSRPFREEKVLLFSGALPGFWYSWSFSSLVDRTGGASALVLLVLADAPVC